MTAPVLPPEPERDGLHYIVRGTRQFARYWFNGKWHACGCVSASPEEAAIGDGAYLCPIPTPDELSGTRAEIADLTAEMARMAAEIADLKDEREAPRARNEQLTTRADEAESLLDHMHEVGMERSERP